VAGHANLGFGLSAIDVGLGKARRRNILGLRSRRVRGGLFLNGDLETWLGGLNGSEDRVCNEVDAEQDDAGR
jgi:hypothetical protein